MLMDELLSYRTCGFSLVEVLVSLLLISGFSLVLITYQIEIYQLYNQELRVMSVFNILR